MHSGNFTDITQNFVLE